MRLRLILAFLFLIAITLAGVAYFSSQGAAREVQSYLGYGGPVVVPNLIEALENYYQTHDTWAGAEKLFPRPSGGPGPGPRFGPSQGAPPVNLVLVDAQGVVVYDPANPGVAGKRVQDDLGRGIPLKVNSQTVGYLLPPSETALYARLNSASLNAALIAGGAAVVLALVVAYFFLRPVRQLTKAAERLAAGDLSQRVPVKGSDELATLAITFNEMAESLQKAEKRRQSLTADIAHELRTPLAVQRANLEALQDGVYPLTEENLKPIREQNELLSRLVEDLRTLALADAGELQLDVVPTQLGYLIAKVVDGFQSQAVPRGIQLDLEQTENLPQAAVDPLRYEQILNNLLQNALRHTPEEGWVKLHLSENETGVRLTVQDSGPGIAPEALPQVFERFYRGDRSRSRAEGGTGLGLAIARKLTEAQGGSLEARNAHDGGAVFILTLPRAVPE